MGASPRWGQAQDGGKPKMGASPILGLPPSLTPPQSWVGHNHGWATIMGGPQSWVGHNHGWAILWPVPSILLYASSSPSRRFSCLDTFPPTLINYHACPFAP